IGLAAWHLFRAGGPVMKDLSVSKHESWLYRLRRLWAPVFVVGPLALAGLALEGHYFTAYQFCQRLLPSIWLAIAVVLAHAKVMRWLVTARGLLAVQRAKEKRAAKADEASAAAAEAIEVETGEIDLSTVNNHVRRLARCGMVAAIAIGAWMLWGDALPKDNFFVASELWSTVSTKTQAVPKSGAAAPAVAGTATPAEGGYEVVTSDEVVKVAPLHFAIAIGLIWITLVVAVSLPGLLEILLQSRFAADAGARYAICTLLRYAITVFGICVGCSILGVGWGQIQWLAAAMTVGLGFGLQEIFANFVSGIILLFERPIRLGDTITVGDLTGVVTRIRIRATTITDANRRELIVPNKEFITGKLVNWTLSDRSARIQLKIGIEYGTDPELAMSALLETARSHAEVLAEPAPSANFDTFNDSTLEMTLNVFVANLDNLSRIRNELNTAIIKRFGQEGIECAHAHRVVTLRAVVPGATRLLDRLEKLKASA
ncbi:MAG TPA: mechanosensitive ion channel domain-containing protein, partial [Planctomycetia bacterium]|nr:mechanosensitive ion channel domain-containing protein [Planctomycetia bacterium]